MATATSGETRSWGDKASTPVGPIDKAPLVGHGEAFTVFISQIRLFLERLLKIP